MLRRVTPGLIKQKARDQAWRPKTLIALSPLVGTWFQVLFHSPNRGAFHFSVALLFTIGRRGVLSLGRWASRIHATFHDNRATRGFPGEGDRFRVRGYHPLWPAFQSCSPTELLADSLGALPAPTGPSQPPIRNGGSLTRIGFGLVRFRSPLLTESMLSFLSCGYLDVSVPRVGFRHLWIQ